MYGKPREATKRTSQKYIVKKLEELKSYTRKYSFSAKENSKEIKEDMKHKTKVKWRRKSNSIINNIKYGLSTSAKWKRLLSLQIKTNKKTRPKYTVTKRDILETQRHKQTDNKIV